MKIEGYVVVGAILMVMGLFTPMLLSSVELGYEEYYHPSHLDTLAWDAYSAPIWCKTNSLTASAVYFGLYHGEPDIAGGLSSSIFPIVSMTYVVGDMWQSEIPMQGATDTYAWEIPPQNVLEPSGNYWYAFRLYDVTWDTTVVKAGEVSFQEVSVEPYAVITIESAINGATLPMAGSYNYVALTSLVMYAAPNSGYRLDGWTLVAAETTAVGATNPFILPLHSTWTFSIVPTFTTNYAPVASFTKTLQTAEVNEVLSFNAEFSYDSDGSIVSYLWDFDDATTGTGVLSSHAYSIPGDYTVTLTVVDDWGASGIAEAMVTVTGGLSPLTTYVLTIEASTGGTTSPFPDAYRVEEGKEVDVLRVSDSGYVLEYWLIDGEKFYPSASVTVTINQDTSVKAQFIDIEDITEPEPAPAYVFPEDKDQDGLGVVQREIEEASAEVKKQVGVGLGTIFITAGIVVVGIGIFRRGKEAVEK